MTDAPDTPSPVEGARTATRTDDFGRPRRIAVRVLAALGAVTFALVFVFVGAEAGGLLTSSPVGSPDDPAPSAVALAGAAAPGEALHLVGALGALAMGVSGLIGLVVRPQWSGLARHVFAAALGLLVVVPLVGDPDNVGGQAALVDPAFLVLAIPPLLAGLVAGPFRERALVPRLALLAAAALPAGVWWAVGQAMNQRNTFPPTADPHHQAHWHAMAVFGFAAIFVAVAASFGGRGWRLGATTAALGALVSGVTSLAASDAASALPFAGAVAALLWGAGVLFEVVRAPRHP